MRAFEQVALNYINNFPKGESRVAIQYRLASLLLYYYYNQFDNSLKLLNQIIEQSPKTKYAEYSANLILDIYNVRKDYVGLKAAGAKILAIPAQASTATGAQVKQILERANFSTGASFRRVG